jgi:hypothetical protein
VRTKEEAYKTLIKMKRNNVPIEDLRLRDVIEESNGSFLVRDTSLFEMRGRYYRGIQYEIWHSREHFEQRIRSQDGQIFCTSVATDDEEEMIETFRRNYISRSLSII